MVYFTDAIRVSKTQRSQIYTLHKYSVALQQYHFSKVTVFPLVQSFMTPTDK